MARFHPSHILRGRTSLGGKPTLRRSLTAFQFAISLGLVAVTLIVGQQLRFVQAERLGFDAGQVVIVDRGGAESSAMRAFERSVEALASVEVVSLAYSLPTQPDAIGVLQRADVAGTCSPTEVKSRVIAQQLQLGRCRLCRARWALAVADGRFFDASRDDAQSVVVNQTMGRRARNRDTDRHPHRVRPSARQREIVGVLADHHAESMHDAVQPGVWDVQRRSDDARRHPHRADD